MNKRVLLILAITVAILVAGGLVVAAKLRKPATLEVRLTVESADLGIPGVSKVYKAVLHNRGTGPAMVARCDFMDDASGQGTMLAEALEKWNAPQNRWETVFSDDEKHFCKPAALSITRGVETKKLLWPGQTLETEEEATAGRDGFHKGDRAHFVVFLDGPGDFQHSLTTEAFTLDEESTSDVSLKVRH